MYIYVTWEEFQIEKKVFISRMTQDLRYRSKIFQFAVCLKESHYIVQKPCNLACVTLYLNENQLSLYFQSRFKILHQLRFFPKGSAEIKDQGSMHLRAASVTKNV